jgi:hypothetical protein
MNIDLSQLTESELIDLNRRIVERLRMIRQVHAHVKMMEFSIGERVWFQADLRRVEGVLVRYNKKSVTIVTDDGERWTVSPGFLERAEAKSSGQMSHIVQMRKAEPGN